MLLKLWNSLERSGALGRRIRRRAEQKQASLEAAIRHMYILVFHRRASAEELKSWVDTVGARPSASRLADAINAIATSPDAVLGDDLLPNLSHGVFIQLAHEIILQRGALPRDIVRYECSLEQGLRRSALVAGLFQHYATSMLDKTERRGVTTNDPTSLPILGTNTHVTTGDWQRRAAEITGGSTAMLPTRGSHSRFSLLSGQGVVVTAIVSLYKGSAFISRFMENICSQSIFKNYCELIIVDADSPENEHETIKLYMDRFPNITYIRAPVRIEVYEAWNLAISKARGKYVTNTNLDDLRRTDSFELQAATLDNVKFADIVYQDFFYSFDRNLGFDEVAAFGITSKLPVVCPNNLLAFNSPHHAPMWRRSLHDEIGLFDTNYRSAGDWEFWIRCALAGKQFYKINDPHAAYLVNPEGVSTRSDTRGMVESQRILRVHARSMVSEHLVSRSERFLEEIRRRSALAADIRDVDRSSEEWRYAAIQRALRQVSVASRRAGSRGLPKRTLTIRPLRLVVDCVVFQLAYSGIARLWTSVLPVLLNRGRLHMVLLDRGNAPDLRGVERIPFPSYGPQCNAQDSLLLQKICELHSADVFLSTYYATPLRTPSLSVVYDMIPERLGWDDKARMWREKDLAISHGRRHLCISERTRLDLLEFYPELDRNIVDVAYCGVDPETFVCGSLAVQQSLRIRLGLGRPFYILVGSRIHGQGYKNLRLFFEAISRMRDIDFDVLCVGGEPQPEPWIAELTPASCRVVCAQLSDNDLALAYGAAVALIYPSLYEGFGIPVIEAMACGCPVITTNRGGLAEAAGSAACIIDGHSISQMTEALRAVRVPPIRERLKRAGADQAAKFRWSGFVDALVQNVQLISEEAKNGRFTDFYDRWSKLRALQNEVDTAI